MAADHPIHLTRLMEEAVAFATAHVHDGGIPFSAFVIDAAGTVLGRGVNRVRHHHDPTAHAEVEAIRDACRAHRTPYLPGATLLASGEPCAMCYMTAFQAGISQIFFAVDRDEAATQGFDYRSGYSLFAVDPLRWSTPANRKLAVEKALGPFATFNGHPRRLSMASSEASLDQTQPGKTRNGGPMKKEDVTKGIHASHEHSAVRAFEEVNHRMHADMAIEFTGQADVDVVRGMIPHHQGAIDMAHVVLEHGSDPDVRALAELIISTQEAEIQQMRKWLSARGR